MISTNERVAKVETKIDSMHEDIREIKESMKNLNHNFAGKWVEKVSVTLLVTILGTITVYAFQNLR